MDSLNIQEIVRQLVLITPGFLLAITVHEYSHGYVALRLGDPTAKLAGRLTFNPIAHLDPIGTLALVLTQMIGWAKPVPVDPRYLRNPRQDMIWISLGGPAANLVAAIALTVLFHTVISIFDGRPATQLTAYFVQPLVKILYYGIRINVVLAIFNLIPIPPLDGSSILAGLLPRDLANQYEKLQPYGFMLLLLFIFTGAVNYIIMPPFTFMMKLLVG